MKRFIDSIVKIISWVISHTPNFIRYRFGDFLGLLWFDVFRIRRQVIIDNISRVFPDKPDSEKIKMGRRSLFHMGRDLVDYSFLPNFSEETLNDRFIFEGEELFKKALSKEKGICLLTMHLGNGDLSLAALSQKGYPMHLVSKLFKLNWLNDIWFGMREKVGTRFIAPRNSSYQILKALKKKEVVIFVQDQFTGPPIGVRSTFFGHETGTGLGLALMAQRSRAPVVPVYTYRLSSGRNLIRFLPEVPFEEKESKDESLAHMTQVYNSVLEKCLLECPDQWMWVHKRWKRFKY